MSTAEKLAELVGNSPATTASIASEMLGVSKQRIFQIAKKAGLKLRDGRMDKASSRDTRWKNHWGGPEGLCSNFVGGAGELFAAANLLRRGIPVFRAMTSVANCDLIADVDGVLLRIEVRCAKVKDGRFAFAYPQAGRYDVLALVDQNGIVTFRPNHGIHWPP